MTTDLFDDEEDTETPEQDNAARAQARIDRDKAKLKKRVEELEAALAEREKADRQASVTKTFAEIGLNPKWSSFYQDEDATPEAVKAWAIANDFVQVEEEHGDDTPGPRGPERTHGFTPTVIEGGHIPAGKTYTRKEFEDVMRENPERGRALWEAGKVQLNNPQIQEGR